MKTAKRLVILLREEFEVATTKISDLHLKNTTLQKV